MISGQDVSELSIGKPHTYEIWIYSINIYGKWINPEYCLVGRGDQSWLLLKPVSVWEGEIISVIFIHLFIFYLFVYFISLACPQFNKSFYSRGSQTPARRVCQSGPARLCCLFLFLIIFMWQYETCLNLITFCVHTTVMKV